MAYTFSESHIRHKNHVFVPTAPRGPRSKTQKPRVCTHSPQRPPEARHKNLVFFLPTAPRGPQRLDTKTSCLYPQPPEAFGP